MSWWKRLFGRQPDSRKSSDGLSVSREPQFTVISGDLESWARELGETDAEFGEMYYQCPKCAYSVRINDIGKMMLKTGVQTFKSQFGERKCKKCGHGFIAHENVRKGNCPDFDYGSNTQR
jgi:hypothetical protein